MTRCSGLGRKTQNPAIWNVAYNICICTCTCPCTCISLSTHYMFELGEARRIKGNAALRSPTTRVKPSHPDSMSGAGTRNRTLQIYWVIIFFTFRVLRLVAACL
ncbi:hypothetical protein B0J11DRAFT_538009 [Dendryphion nanum]|uniref:Uncharacterized protein n=1 Tax=Dendryphion nanum TaxID=256645 RepID=A0A9P9DAT9_9PLEO|nr:hypothetical protein B0J11DRAFT_538009 [Dendryphion nanum]